jgi:hypothetical protein
MKGSAWFPGIVIAHTSPAAVGFEGVCFHGEQFECQLLSDAVLAAHVM